MSNYNVMVEFKTVHGASISGFLVGSRDAGMPLADAESFAESSIVSFMCGKECTMQLYSHYTGRPATIFIPYKFISESAISFTFHQM